MSSEPHFRFRSGVALVTGAGRGLGQGIALRLADVGYTVAVNDLYEERAAETISKIREAGGKATSAVFDVRDFEAVNAAARSVENDVGAVSVLVNNAGIPDSFVPTQFMETGPDDWEPFLKVNLYGTLHCARVFAGSMQRAKWGRVINIVSEAWRVGTPLGISLYGSAKAGIVGFTRHLSSELAKDGVTANCLSLGEMDNLPFAKELAKRYPTGRLGTADDVASAVLYLVSENADWMTGQTIPVNGGLLTA